MKIYLSEETDKFTNDSQAKLVFISRLFQNLQSKQCGGFIFHVRKLLAKYGLSDYLLNYA